MVEGSGAVVDVGNLYHLQPWQIGILWMWTMASSKMSPLYLRSGHAHLADIF